MKDTITNATVTISWQVGDRQPQVNPSNATISPSGVVTFQVTVPSGDTAEIDFAVKEGVKGPFPVNGQPNNPSRGVYDGPSSSIVTAAADQAANTDWKYSVLIYDSNHNLLSSIDPGIQIRN